MLSRSNTITFIILEVKIIHDILSKLISTWKLFMCMEEKSSDFKAGKAIIWLKSELVLSGFFLVVSNLSTSMRVKLWQHSFKKG